MTIQPSQMDKTNCLTPHAHASMVYFKIKMLSSRLTRPVGDGAIVEEGEEGDAINYSV